MVLGSSITLTAPFLQMEKIKNRFSFSLTAVTILPSKEEGSMVVSIIKWGIFVLLSAMPRFAASHPLPTQIDSQWLIESVKTFTQASNTPFQESICQLLDTLSVTSMVIREGSDADQRPLFVNAQADFERAIVYWLKTKQIAGCTCVIHTPAPATPLCTKGEITHGLVDPAIQNDPQRLLTVKKRPEIIRDYLQEGGILYTAFPKKGRGARSEEQLAILEGLVESHPDHLHVAPLNCDAIPQTLIGATYLISLNDSSSYVLSLRSYQANSPTDDKWGIWFGSLDNAAVENRFQAVKAFLENQGFLPFRS